MSGTDAVLGLRIDATDVDEAAKRVAGWARERRGGMVCAANVHMVMEAYDDAAFQGIVNAADLIVADGRPLVWASQLLGRRGVRHVRGLDITLRLCGLATQERLAVAFYGGAPEVTGLLKERLNRSYPRLEVVGVWSPPFRSLTAAEDAAAVAAIETAGTQLLFVGLGCPKQEKWMAAHRERLSCAMVGVGAVFDMLAGRQSVAPRWMQRAGLEWAYRLAREPRRLWRRYARHNVRFMALFALQLLRTRWRRLSPGRESSG